MNELGKKKGISGSWRADAILCFAVLGFAGLGGGCGGAAPNNPSAGGSVAPSIAGLSPASGVVGTSVTIAGANFGATQGTSAITFNGIPATPTSWTATSIDAPVPAGATSGNVVVTVGGVASNGVGFAVGPSNPSASGWTYIQDSPLVFCSPGPKSGCTITTGNIAPTTAGSVWILYVQTTNNVTISSVCNGAGCTGTNGGWTHCPNCHATNSAGINVDAWYNLTGPAGTFQNITFTISGSSGSIFGGGFVELLPPPGATASYDTSAIATPTNCVACTGPALIGVSATDGVYINPGGGAQANWNSVTSPYILDTNGGSVGLNITGSTAPTITFVGTTNPEFFGIAFKSSLGSFAPPTHQYSIVSYKATGGFTNCSTSPGCTVAIPTTGAGHLLFVEAGDEFGQYITSVSDSAAGTWVVPSGANTCRIGFTILGQNNQNSCAYNLSSGAGLTQLKIQTSGSAATFFAVWEIATTNGSFAPDAQASQVNNSNSYYNNGPALTLSGANDVIFQSEWCVGGSNGPTLYAQPNIPYNAALAVGPTNYFLFNETSSAVLLDSGPVQAALGIGSSAPVPVWFNPQNDPTFVSAVAFKTQ